MTGEKSSETVKGFDVPLLGRAWTIQGRILSSQVLNFGRAELLLECLAEYKCECTDGLDVNTTYAKAENAARLQRALESELAARWRNVIMEYTDLDITYPNDRWLPLLDIANQFLAMSPSQFIAGCRKLSLRYDLLWLASGHGERMTANHRYPTWS
jgi:hypothetical protein